MRIANALAWVLAASLLPTQAAMAADKCTGQDTPRLVVVISVDQMRADYLSDRRLEDGVNQKRGLQPLYTGGFKTFLDEGAVFTQAMHLHAMTMTGPGHASLSTGTHPRHHGIVSNSWFDRSKATKGPVAANQAASTDPWSSVMDPWVESVPAGLDQGKRSPIHLKRPALGDFLKEQCPDARVVSIATKDRAAILMGGLRPDLASWLDTETGQWVTSTWYMKSAPPWLDAFNSSQANSKPWAWQYLSYTWTRSIDPDPQNRYETMSRADKFDGEARKYKGLFETDTFPHKVRYPRAGITDPEVYRLVKSSPFGDEITLEMARQAIRGEQLGVDETPDLLWIGLSAPDYIGHLFGPWSQEAMDEYLRLDGVIEQFIGELDKSLGRDNYLVVLTADHGAPPIPDFAANALSIATAGRSRQSDFEDEVRAAFKPLVSPEVYDALNPAHKDIFGFSFDLDKLSKLGISRNAVEWVLKGVVERMPEVEAAYARSEILHGAVRDQFAGLYANTYHDGRSQDVLVRLKPYYVVSNYGTGTSHGSPYLYDRHVPLVFLGSGVKSRTISDPVASVDIAPTLARLLGIKANPLEPDSRELNDLIW